MPINRKTWLSFIILSIFSAAVWFYFTYPQLSFIQLSIDRQKAFAIAEDFMKNDREIDLTGYRHAVVFAVAKSVDQYLQRAIGFKEEMKFIKEHDYELFSWRARFFKENEKEEYMVALSASTGEILGYSRAIKESDPRPDQGEEIAKQKVIDFLHKRYAFNPEDHVLHVHTQSKKENRIDYTFSWEKKDVLVHWSKTENSGAAKLLTGATISGDEVLDFSKHTMKIPEEFYRHLDREMMVGRNLAILFRIAFFALLTTAIFLVAVRRNNLVMHTTKWFAIGLTVFIFGCNVLSYFNEFESVWYSCPTTSSIVSYLWRGITWFLMDTFIVSLGILMPTLAGESLRYEVSPEKKRSSFLHYVHSTFFSRDVAKLIGFGYLAGCIMIGIQSIAFEVGQRYLGVWIEYTWMTQMTSSYLPFLSAFILGFVASSTEEIAFRLFSINLGKKFFKNTFLAVFVASVFWGYGHSSYLVFPMWFRGLEVSCMGFFLAFVYLRFGIIPVLVAHYIFDVFWSASAHILGQSTSYQFYSAVAVILLPFLWSIIAYFRNQSEEERKMIWRLSKHQLFNLEVLKHFLRDKNLVSQNNPEQVIKEIVAHGWDIAVVEIAIADLQNELSRKEKV